MLKKDEKKMPATACCGGGPEPTATGGSNSGGYHWQRGAVATPAGPVVRVATCLEWRDMAGTWKARWGVGRMNYRIPPGLYAVGTPGPDSPVMVSCNYKLSFDCLRRELSGLNLWLMVLETNGVNVWCAAGKGTFGTAEVVSRIEKVRLDEIVSHRTVILPQLAAPGVAGHQVYKQSGFRVIFGPVRACDIPSFLQAGFTATPAMRQVGFSFRERLALIPMELAHLVRPGLILAALLFGLNSVAAWLRGGSLSPALLLGRTANDLIPYLGAVLAGAVLVPALLPYIPGRAFAWKGWLSGALWAVFYIFYLSPGTGTMQAAAYLLFLPAVSAFLAMNFTGSATYTSLSGVLKEMSLALPVIVVSAGLGLCGLIIGWFL